MQKKFSIRFQVYTNVYFLLRKRLANHIYFLQYYTNGVGSANAAKTRRKAHALYIIGFMHGCRTKLFLHLFIFSKIVYMMQSFFVVSYLYNMVLFVKDMISCNEIKFINNLMHIPTKCILNFCISLNEYSTLSTQ